MFLSEFCVRRKDTSVYPQLICKKRFEVCCIADGIHTQSSAEHHCLTRTMIPGQFSPEDFERFTDICKLFEANSRLDFITVSRCLSVPQPVFHACAPVCAAGWLAEPNMS